MERGISSLRSMNFKETVRGQPRFKRRGNKHFFSMWGKQILDSENCVDCYFRQQLKSVMQGLSEWFRFTASGNIYDHPGLRKVTGLSGPLEMCGAEPALMEHGPMGVSAQARHCLVATWESAKAQWVGQAGLTCFPVNLVKVKLATIEKVMFIGGCLGENIICYFFISRFLNSKYPKESLMF